jgi:hypothetical protein
MLIRLIFSDTQIYYELSNESHRLILLFAGVLAVATVISVATTLISILLILLFLR